MNNHRQSMPYFYVAPKDKPSSILLYDLVKSHDRFFVRNNFYHKNSNNINWIGLVNQLNFKQIVVVTKDCSTFRIKLSDEFEKNSSQACIMIEKNISYNNQIIFLIKFNCFEINKNATDYTLLLDNKQADFLNEIYRHLKHKTKDLAPLTIKKDIKLLGYMDQSRILAYKFSQNQEQLFIKTIDSTYIKNIISNITNSHTAKKILSNSRLIAKAPLTWLELKLCSPPLETVYQPDNIPYQLKLTPINMISYEIIELAYIDKVKLELKLQNLGYYRANQVQFPYSINQLLFVEILTVAIADLDIKASWDNKTKMFNATFYLKLKATKGKHLHYDILKIEQNLIYFLNVNPKIRRKITFNRYSQAIHIRCYDYKYFLVIQSFLFSKLIAPIDSDNDFTTKKCLSLKNGPYETSIIEQCLIEAKNGTQLVRDTLLKFFLLVSLLTKPTCFIKKIIMNNIGYPIKDVKFPNLNSAEEDTSLDRVLTLLTWQTIIMYCKSVVPMKLINSATIQLIFTYCYGVDNKTLSPRINYYNDKQPTVNLAVEFIGLGNNRQQPGYQTTPIKIIYDMIVRYCNHYSPIWLSGLTRLVLKYYIQDNCSPKNNIIIKTLLTNKPDRSSFFNQISNRFRPKLENSKNDEIDNQKTKPFDL